MKKWRGRKGSFHFYSDEVRAFLRCEGKKLEFRLMKICTKIEYKEEAKASRIETEVPSIEEWMVGEKYWLEHGAYYSNKYFSIFVEFSA